MTTTPAASFGGRLYQGSGSAALRSTETQACWLCGIQLPATSMVPDGGPACADVRWYCGDSLACTRRWTPSHARPGRPLRESRTRPAVPTAGAGHS